MEIDRQISRAYSIQYVCVYLSIYIASECMHVFIMNKISWIHQSSGDCGFTMSEENFYCTIILNVIFFYFVGGNQPVSDDRPCGTHISERVRLQYRYTGITIYKYTYRYVQHNRSARSSAISNPDNYSTTL